MVTVATEVSELDHVTPEVVLWSIMVINRSTEQVLCERLTEDPFLTVIVQVADLVAVLAVMVTVPAFTAVTIPELLTVAMDVLELLKLTAALDVAFK